MEDFLKGFEIDDYDLDLGISFVDAQPNQQSAATAETVNQFHLGLKI